MNVNLACLFIVTLFLSTQCSGKTNELTEPLTNNTYTNMSDTIVKSDEEWKKELSQEEYQVLRKHGTEPAFNNEYNDNKEKGIYHCAGCGNPVFSSETKFDSGTGWPSFYAPISEEKVGTEKDRAFGMVRTEVHCARCKGHLGHIFEDGPKPTGLRYCLNSISLDFEEER